MKITLDRYYGDGVVTKSFVTITMDGAGAPVLKCEAREPKFCDYTEAFAGCSSYCLACGQYDCKVVSTDLSPMTLTVVKSPGHRCCRFHYDESRQVRANTVLLGAGDGNEDLKWRRIIGCKTTYMEFEKLVYECFVRGEKITLFINSASISDGNGQ